jgi:hypothetical protein
LLIQIGGACSTNGDIKCIQILVGKPERKIPHGRPMRTWENNIKMDLREIGWEVADWIHLAQDRNQWWGLMNTVMNLRVS